MFPSLFRAGVGGLAKSDLHISFQGGIVSVQLDSQLAIPLRHCDT